VATLVTRPQTARPKTLPLATAVVSKDISLVIAPTEVPVLVGLLVLDLALETRLVTAAVIPAISHVIAQSTGAWTELSATNADGKATLPATVRTLPLPVDSRVDPLEASKADHHRLAVTAEEDSEIARCSAIRAVATAT
jgi:hypothetical protein